jgi:hypothetical protein
MTVRWLPALALFATFLAPASARAQLDTDKRIPPANPELLVPPEHVPPSPDSPMQAVVLINSIGGAYPYQCAALKQAYEDAWIF